MSPKSNDIVVFTNAKTKNSELYYADLIITVSGPLLGNFVGLSKSYTESIFATIILEGIYDLGSKIFAKIFAKILLNFQFRVDLKKKKSPGEYSGFGIPAQIFLLKEDYYGMEILPTTIVFGTSA